MRRRIRTVLRSRSRSSRLVAKCPKTGADWRASVRPTAGERRYSANDRCGLLRRQTRCRRSGRASPDCAGAAKMPPFHRHRFGPRRLRPNAVGPFRTATAFPMRSQPASGGRRQYRGPAAMLHFARRHSASRFSEEGRLTLAASTEANINAIPRFLGAQSTVSESSGRGWPGPCDVDRNIFPGGLP
jgi:hypothetical protein